MLKDRPIRGWTMWRISYALSRDESKSLWTLYEDRYVVGVPKRKAWKKVGKHKFQSTDDVIKYLTKTEGITLNALEVWPDKSRAPSMDELRDAIDRAFDRAFDRLEDTSP
jgi:hypothetical protein